MTSLWLVVKIALVESFKILLQSLSPCIVKLKDQTNKQRNGKNTGIRENDNKI